jgi:hypothetical protein
MKGPGSRAWGGAERALVLLLFTYKPASTSQQNNG